MNFYLLQLIGKWLNLVIISIMSLFGYSIKEITIDLSNDNLNKNVGLLTQVVYYDTIKTYDSSIPSNTTKVLKQGENGLITTLQDGNTMILKDKIDEEVVIGTGAQSEYTGIITGYGPDCSTCSGIGTVACRTEDKKDFNLIRDGIYYQDDEYGSVRVLAAALTKFPCGTIIVVKSNYLGEFTGVVLDTGYDMRKALERGVNHIDVAFLTEEDKQVPYVTDMSGNVTYSVQRWGW